MLTSRRNPSHATMTGMGSLDEELSAMLQTGPHSHGQTSLASVLASTTSPNTADRSRGGGDLFSSQYSSLQGGFGGGNNNNNNNQGGQLASSRNMNMQQKGVDSSTPNMPPSFGRGLSNNPNLMSQQQQQQQAPRWPFANDEKWVIDAKNEALEASSLRSNISNFGTTIDAPTQGLNPQISAGGGGGGGLQRYHSAPSSFLQCLADFNEDAFSQVSSPLRDKDGLLNSFFADNLTPIIECAPQQMDTEKPVTSSSLNDYEQFLASQNDFNSRSRNSGKPEPRSLARSDGLGPASIGDRSAAVFDSLGVRPRQMKNNLIRQSSSPADLLAAIQDSMDESDPSMPIPAMMSPDDSLSGGTSEDNPTGNHSAKSMMYSRDDSFLATDTVVSGGLWNNPTSPGHLGGKRLRVPGDSMTESGLPSDLSPKMRVGEPGSLTRHMSLPIPSRPLSPTMDMGLDDLADFSVPCKTRAKRGFATHPRSIAERVRRTRISERMKKLQDLVPNMDRQTNTADMLDEAVEYVKHLQLQVQELSNTVKELKAKC